MDKVDRPLSTLLCPIVSRNLHAAVPAVMPLAVLYTQYMPSWHGENKCAFRVISGKLRNRIAIRADVRQQMTGEAMIPQIRSPHTVRIALVLAGKTLQAETNIGFIPGLAKSFGDCPHSTVTHRYPVRIWIVIGGTH